MKKPVGRRLTAEPECILMTFQMRRPITSRDAWRLLAFLKQAGPEFASSLFRLGSAGPRTLGRKSELLVAEGISRAEQVGLLRREGKALREVLSCVPIGDGQIIRIVSPMVGTIPEALKLIGLVRSLSEILHPATAVANRCSREGLARQGGLARYDAFPGWLTVFGPDRVAQIGATRLLMSPAYLIETLPDGGILLASSPLPLQESSGVDGRSSTLEDYLRGGGVWPRTPPRTQEGLIPT